MPWLYVCNEMKCICVQCLIDMVPVCVTRGNQKLNMMYSVRSDFFCSTFLLENVKELLQMLHCDWDCNTCSALEYNQLQLYCILVKCLVNSWLCLLGPVLKLDRIGPSYLIVFFLTLGAVVSFAFSWNFSSMKPVKFRPIAVNFCWVFRLAAVIFDRARKKTFDPISF